MAEWKEEVEVLVQRVVKDITGAFRRNPNIDEIGLIPCPEARYNRSPIVLVENKLGVESWCIKFLLPYVHNKLLLYRQKKRLLNRDELIDVTCTLLLLNPDFTTAWNVRKELIQLGALNPIKDLQLGKLALTKFPKSPETWIHRRWILQRFLQECAPPTAVTKEGSCPDPEERITTVLQEEMQVCCEAAGRYPSNYNAWSHRIWVIQHLGKLNVKLLLDELSSTKHWVSMHVSDHSGFHYRQFLLKSLLDRSLVDCENSRKVTNLCPSKQNLCLPREGEISWDPTIFEHLLLLKEEMELISDLINSYPGHETLWCHRRQIFNLIHHLHSEKSHSPNQQAMSSDSSEAPGNGLHSESSFPDCAFNAMDVDGVNDPSKHGYTQETKRLKRAPMQDPFTYESELRFINFILSNCRSSEQSRFAASYRKWLTSSLGMHLPLCILYLGCHSMTL
ncbi:protein prenyltransferase alpha subunit repeat-containing protein 1 isoform X2 [Bombina bombina]|uniref:protein prenyltransferase alpha subunit repeat-containing protein 1 isoform X2 n=1 Tax=Bombina bombina TaxID=8345 RepID=UPI00235A6B78|nr:protein prenyltransferase alpha subunit repeat-containing protein 1 isoform X2 [Bombina bombina]